MFSIFYVFRIKWKRWSVAKADLPNLGKKTHFLFLVCGFVLGSNLSICKNLFSFDLLFSLITDNEI